MIILITYAFYISIANAKEAENIPANATAKSYGSGWKCNERYKKVKDACVFLTIPDDAYATSNTYDKGWKCNYGYAESDGKCEIFVIPENAFLNSYGTRWLCNRGFKKENNINSYQRCRSEFHQRCVVFSLTYMFLPINT